MATWFTSDWHLGDPRVEILGRPFASAKEMTEHIIAEHNRLVAPDDTVYMLGDVLSTTTEETLDVVERFNGTLHLIRGNHDRGYTDEDFLRYFETVTEEGGGVELEVEGIPCWLTHYPTLGRADRLNLVGHIHGIWRIGPDRNSLNVGVDTSFLRPVSSATVKFLYTAIHDFYDEDAWLPNVQPHLERGKPGTYWQAR